MKENRKLLKEVLKDIRHDMTDEEVLNLLADSKISVSPESEKEKYTLGQRAADSIAKFAGSWAFIFSFTGVLILWMLKKIVLFPISLFVAFLALMARWLLTLSSYVVAPLMLYIFGCGIYTAYRQTWDQFLILLVAEFICFILFFGATAITEGIGRFSEWLAEL